MDLDYRALSNAGLWCIGRLQTDADRERVVDGLGDTGPDAEMTKSDVSNVIKKLAPRWFLLRDAHAREGMMLLQPRWAMTLMLGPMTRTEIKRARALDEGRAPACALDDDEPSAVPASRSEPKTQETRDATSEV